MCIEDTKQHDHDDTRICTHENEKNLCHQCGKVHTKFFLEEHHSLREILTDYQ